MRAGFHGLGVPTSTVSESRCHAAKRSADVRSSHILHRHGNKGDQLTSFVVRSSLFGVSFFAELRPIEALPVYVAAFLTACPWAFGRPCFGRRSMNRARGKLGTRGGHAGTQHTVEVFAECSCRSEEKMVCRVSSHLRDLHEGAHDMKSSFVV